MASPVNKDWTFIKLYFIDNACIISFDFEGYLMSKELNYVVEDLAGTPRVLAEGGEMPTKT